MSISILLLYLSKGYKKQNLMKLDGTRVSLDYEMRCAKLEFRETIIRKTTNDRLYR
jgi:hypothetical protein